MPLTVPCTLDRKQKMDWPAVVGSNTMRSSRSHVAKVYPLFPADPQTI